ncbi:MAG: tyrosine-type recombinase/integrase [Planctomycetota bacterium]
MQSKTWWVGYSVDGAKQKESSKSGRKEDAVRLLNKRLAEAQQGGPLPSTVRQVTFEDLCELIQRDYRVQGRKSADRLELSIRHLSKRFKGMRAKQIRTTSVDLYVDLREREGAARSTINKELAALRRMFALASEKGVLPASMVPTIKTPKPRNTRKGFFTEQEYRATLRYLPAHIRPVVECLWETGWRKGNVLSRRWRHVDVEAGEIRLDPGEAKNDEPLITPVTDGLHAVLRQQHERKKEIERRTGRIIQHVFFDDNGKPIGDFRKSWASATKAAECPGRLVHDIRRSFAKRMIDEGLPESMVMALGLWRTPSVFRRYGMVDTDMKRRAVAQLRGRTRSRQERASNA